MIKPSLCKAFKSVLWLSLLGLGIALLSGCQATSQGLLNPKGLIASEERKLFFDTIALMLIVVLPVIIMSLAFVYHYQDSHKIRDYKPNWSHSTFLELLWWGIPCAIIVTLSVITWKKTHELDPYQKINYPGSPLLVKVIALPWKWLFIYPEQNIASVNELVIPVDRQVEYWITADNVPMSAFFIPQLGSQIYAMVGMRTRLHLVATQTGNFMGLNSQFNGNGFSDMHFAVHVVSASEFNQWANKIKKSEKSLTDAAYHSLLNPSENDKPSYFSKVDADLFENVMDVYMNTYGKVHPRDSQIKSYHLAH